MLFVFLVVVGRVLCFGVCFWSVGGVWCRVWCGGFFCELDDVGGGIFVFF